MFWTIAGLVLALVLIGAWLYDRRFGHAITHRDEARYNEARGYSDLSRFNNGAF